MGEQQSKLSYYDKNTKPTKPSKDSGYFDSGVGNPLHSIRNYTNSTAAKAKEHIIRTIATIFVGVELLKGIKPETDDISTLAAAINKRIHNLKIINTENVSAKACKIISNVINREFSPSSPIIRIEGVDAIAICLQIQEHIDTITRIIHNEFISVLSSVKLAIGDLANVSSYLNKFHDIILAEDDIVKRANDQVMYDAMIKMKESNLKMLNYLLGITISENINDIVPIIDKKVTERMNANDWLQYNFKSICTFIILIDKINSAFEKFGLTLSEYKKSSEWDEFNAILRKNRMEIDSETFADFESATSTLYELYGDHQ